MRRLSFVVVAVAFFPIAGQAEVVLPAAMVTAIKAATVFVKIEAEDLSGSGSGFVVKTEGNAAYVVTNCHVVEPRLAELVIAPESRSGQKKKGSSNNFSARVVFHTYKNASVTVVFRSGTKDEESIRGEVVAADSEKDLAVIKVTGLKQVPTPIDYVHEPRLSEIMPIYSFGFPFGEALATSKGSPAITVGKGSISSLRMDDDGNLAVVQIDGALNPGNSGGPVVDAQGRLVGIAVAIIRESNNIGFAIPSREVSQILKGRLDKVAFETVKESDGQLKLRVTAGLIDPLNKIKAAEFFYLDASSVKDKPKPDSPLDSLPGCRKLTLKIENHMATGTVPLKQGVTEIALLHQTVSVNEAGQPARANSLVETIKVRLPPPPAQPPAEGKSSQAIALDGHYGRTGKKGSAPEYVLRSAKPQQISKTVIRYNAGCRAGWSTNGDVEMCVDGGTWLKIGSWNKVGIDKARSNGDWHAVALGDVSGVKPDAQASEIRVRFVQRGGGHTLNVFKVEWSCE